MTSTGDDDSETDSLPDYEIRSNDELSNEDAYIKRSDSDIEGDTGSDDEGNDRDNRYTGSSNTWRYFTLEERALAASLDQQQANDLSLHLYCAHALKARVRDLDSEAPRGKKQRVDKADDNSVWCPDATWTAWPMRPEDLPKMEERFGAPISGTENEGGYGRTWLKDGEQNSNNELRQEIRALMLKKATDRFRARRTNQSTEVVESDLLLDDEKAEEALRPALSKMRSQLDDLLLRLQSKRKRQAGKRKRSQSGSSRSQSVCRASTPAMAIRRKAPISSEFIADSESESSDDPASGSDLSNNIASPSIPQTKERRPKHLKGWQEVLHVATLSGFDQQSVQRAANRCVSLFGEDATLPTLYDCPISTCKRYGVPFDKGWRWREHLRRTHKLELGEIYDLEASLKTTNNA